MPPVDIRAFHAASKDYPDTPPCHDINLWMDGVRICVREQQRSIGRGNGLLRRRPREHQGVTKSVGKGKGSSLDGSESIVQQVTCWDG